MNGELENVLQMVATHLGCEVREMTCERIGESSSYWLKVKTGALTSDAFKLDVMGGVWEVFELSLTMVKKSA